MNNKAFVIVAVACIAAMTWTGCATRRQLPVKETTPRISVTPNSSGMSLQDMRSKGPTALLGADNSPPDIPTSSAATVVGPANNRLGALVAVSIERPDLYEEKSLAETIRKWKLLIDGVSMTKEEERQMLYDDQLQEIPWQDAGRDYPVKLRRVTFPWGKAVLFLTAGYSQGPSGGGVVNNENLGLILQGFTNDGRFAVNGHLSIHNPRLPDTEDDKNQQGKMIFDWDHDSEKAAEWLESKPDDSFTPTLQQYEEFLQSLQINASGK